MTKVNKKPKTNKPIFYPDMILYKIVINYKKIKLC